MLHTPNRSGRQAAELTPDPHAHDALTVTDGQHVAGFIVERDDSHFAFDHAGELIGEFKTRAEAMRALPARSG